MSVLLLLSAGRGPRECAWALAHLVRRLEADAARNQVTVTRAGDNPEPRNGRGEGHGQGRGPGDRDGHAARSVLLRLSGPAVAGFAASWTGTLCWQAPSPYRGAAGRKNWYVAARQVPPPPAARPFSERDVEVVACRTGGPGGQHRNKASTAARARHRPTGTVVTADRERYFTLNRSRALELLRQRLAGRADAELRDALAARWRVHDELVRGDPVRVERP